MAATARAGARQVQATAASAAEAVKKAAKGKSAKQLTAIAVGAVAATAAAVAAAIEGRQDARAEEGRGAPEDEPAGVRDSRQGACRSAAAKAAPASKSAPLKATVAKEKPKSTGSGDAKIGVPPGSAARDRSSATSTSARGRSGPDGLDKVTGRARFAADMILPGMLYGHVLRSPHAHAKIVSIDTKAALAMPGVKAVVTRDDFPEFPPGHPMRDTAYNLMARDRVRYEGQAVAAVAATTRRQAREAAAAIKVSYEVLPQVMTVDEAMADNAILLNEGMMTRGQDPAPTKASNVAMKSTFKAGDLDAGFAEADVVVEGDFITKPVHQGYIEPHAVVADSTQEDKAVVWCSSQGHFRVQQQTAGMLGWQPSQIKVLPAEIGGGFGGKTTIYLEPLAVLLSRKANRPVKMVMARDEVFRATGPASGTHIKVKLGAKKDGTLVAGKAWMAYECGPFGGFWGDGRRLVRVRALPHPQLSGRELRGLRQQAGQHRVSRARGAAGRVRDRDAGRPDRREARHRSDRDPAAQRREAGRSVGAGPSLPRARTEGDARGDPRQPAVQEQAHRQEPGTRRCDRILVQHR